MNCHDKILNRLEQIVKDAPMKGRNVEYGFPHRTIGEIDYFIFSEGILHLFEVKSNYKHELRDKAIKQLYRAHSDKRLKFHEYLGIKPNRIQKYYVTRHGRNNFKPVIEFIGGINL